MNNRILLVDDDQELLAALELKLDKEGFQVETAPDGEVALEIIKKKLPDLVILDVNMPKVNGMEVCKSLRSDEQTRDLAVIMLVVPEKPYFQRKMVKKVRVFIQQSVENGF
mgnify:CR=1 FL=1